MVGSLILAAMSAVQQAPEFHQGVSYTIEAVLNDSTHVLRGRERVRYRNNSPQKIDTIWFHLHLNAFRPNSAWAQRELQSGNRRFQDLGPDDHAYERIRSIRVGGRLARPVFPGSPDSTVMGVPLPTPLVPGMSVSVLIDWTARLSTLPRRQGRAGSHYDFAQWYPRVAVYDRGGWQTRALLPQGEFYGEFADYDVTVEVPRRHVVGATGVAVSGDPGWAAANIDKTRPPLYRRDAYRRKHLESLGLFDRKVNSAHKRIRWRAEDVHHFAWTTNPDYAYEGGAVGNTAVHVLFQKHDTTWAGHALARTVKAMKFLESLFGPYPYPQITNVHRVEGGGGTEFPMMIMDASASEGLIVHEIAHQWAHGILGNNEFKEGWLDEGMASFVGGSYAEAQGQGTNYEKATQDVARADSAGAKPVATPSAEFSNMDTYAMATYTKPSLIFRMLHDYLGDGDFRAGLKLYYEKNKLQHVDEQDFKNAMEAAEKADLDWFFDQWLHTNKWLDYSVTNATSTQLPNGTWRTRVDVARAGEAWMPVRLKVGDVVRLLDSPNAAFSAEVDTEARPTEVVLDPDAVLLDTNRANNRRAIAQ